MHEELALWGHLFLKIRHFLIHPPDESWPTDSLLPDVLCHRWAGHGGSPQAKQGEGRWEDVPTAGHSLAWFKSAATAPGPRGAVQLHLPFIPAKTLRLSFPDPAPAQTWICTNAGPWSFCFFICLRGSKKIFISFLKQQSSCVSLKFPMWQCAGSWWSLQTKPKLWELVWSLHLC